jgi:hypothetical protein
MYYGVVHNSRIELEGDTHLPEGARVEVRLREPSDTTTADKVVKARLRAAGLLAPAPIDAVGDDEEDDAFEPAAIQGEPLSEQIIRERR